MNPIPEVPIDWTEVPTERPADLVDRQTVHGRNFTLIRYTYRAGAVFPEHRHPQEQITLVLSGRLEFTVNGGAASVGPGQFLRLGPDVPHGARVVGEDTVVSLNFFSPARSEHPHAE